MKSYVIIKRLMVTGLNEKNLERAHKGEFIVNAIHITYFDTLCSDGLVMFKWP